MKRLLILIPALCFMIQASAQSKSIKNETNTLNWNKGQVIFHSGDTLECNLRFIETAAEGLLQVMDDERIVTLDIKHVKSFSFYESQINRLRKYFSIALALDQPVSKEFFLECLYNDNQFSILRHKTVGVPYDYMNYSRFISKPARITRKYILNLNTGELLPLSKEHALKLMEKRKAEISSFIQSHDIKFKKVADYVHVFEYHASL